MSSLKPDIRQMLLMGKVCGLSTLQEAFENYMCHYDCFFLISDMQNQYKVFMQELIDNELANDYDDGTHLVDCTIEFALEKLC